MTDRPDYIITASRAFGRLPYVATKALLQGGWLKASNGALQSFLDRSLNRVYPGKVRFVSVLPHVLYTALHVPEMRSGDPRDRNRGYVAETDISFWILTLGGVIGHELDWKLRWTPAYMFVDDAAAVAGGREIFGFPKLFSRIARTSERKGDFGLTVNVDALVEFGPDKPVKPFDLFTVDTTDDGTEQLISEADLRKHFMAGLEMDHLPADIFHLMQDLHLPQVNFPTLMLKQFPSVDNPNTACYQALIEDKMTTTRLYEGWKARGTPQLNIKAAQSLLMAEELGMAADQELKGALWLVQDFETGFGAEITPEA